MCGRVVRLTFMDYNLNSVFMAFKSDRFFHMFVSVIYKCTTIIRSLSLNVILFVFIYLFFFE